MFPCRRPPPTLTWPLFCGKIRIYYFERFQQRTAMTTRPCVTSRAMLPSSALRNQEFFFSRRCGSSQVKPAARVVREGGKKNYRCDMSVSHASSCQMNTHYINICQRVDWTTLRLPVLRSDFTICWNSRCSERRLSILQEMSPALVSVLWMENCSYPLRKDNGICQVKRLSTCVANCFLQLQQTSGNL